ncbi:MAG: DinB family protein [Chloroflexota bacterium]
MNADAINTLYHYHYGRLRQIWESIMTLTDAQFTQDVPYSLGSLRNQMVHLINDDSGWMTLMQGLEKPALLNPQDYTTRASVRAVYDRMEADNLKFIASMDDAALQREYIWHPPFTPEPQRLAAWQILVHVVNHGTDHRAQILRVLHDLGAPSFDQDLMGYLVQTGRTAIKP